MAQARLTPTLHGPLSLTHSLPGNLSSYQYSPVKRTDTNGQNVLPKKEEKEAPWRGAKISYHVGSGTLCSRQYISDPLLLDREETFGFRDLQETRAPAPSAVRREDARAASCTDTLCHRCCNGKDYSFLTAHFEVSQGIILLSVNNTEHTVDKLSILP